MSSSSSFSDSRSLMEDIHTTQRRKTCDVDVYRLIKLRQDTTLYM